MSTLDYTVAICTRNRADVLPKCLDALAEVEFDRKRFEVVVIDNGSTDRTQAVLRAESPRGRLPLRVVIEQEAGLDRARNAAVREAQGRRLIYLDDDALVVPGWLGAFDMAFQSGGCQIVQGRVRVKFAEDPPDWFDPEWLPRFGHLDCGEEQVVYDGNLHGCNMGFERAVFDKIGLFRPDLDVGARPAGLGGDTEFGMRAAAAGFAAMYVPGATVEHLIPGSRMTLCSLIRRFYVSGASQPYFKQYDDPTGRMLLHLGKASLGRAARAVFTFDNRKRAAELCGGAEQWGRVMSVLRKRSSAGTWTSGGKT